MSSLWYHSPPDPALSRRSRQVMPVGLGCLLGSLFLQGTTVGAILAVAGSLAMAASGFWECYLFLGRR